MTFIVNRDGVVYEKNLGPAPTPRPFDHGVQPDPSWNRVAPAK